MPTDPAPPSLAAVVTATGIVAVGALDLLSGAAYGMFVLYYLPVAYAGWRLGVGGAVAASVASAVVWLAADLVVAAPVAASVVAWNSAVRLVAFLAIGWAVARLQEVLDRERRLSGDLADALEEVRVLRGLVPVCAWCRKVRDEDGEWHSFESYIKQHTEAEVTHGMCDACAREQLGQAGLSEASL